MLLELGTISGSVHVARGMLVFWASSASPYYRQYFERDVRIVLFRAAGGLFACAERNLKAKGLKT